ncbi:MAG: hypothetical protein BWX80_02212 [Candidatus Hydrogenedentes bacterium ADurb.Bin101]|nr:MAG: hypothetical protein BWX80_02212 [Candidatus Hydrogenedentes bacterium ADurb.Bin101]
MGQGIHYIPEPVIIRAGYGMAQFILHTERHARLVIRVIHGAHGVCSGSNPALVIISHGRCPSQEIRLGNQVSQLIIRKGHALVRPGRRFDGRQSVHRVILVGRGPVERVRDQYHVSGGVIFIVRLLVQRIGDPGQFPGASAAAGGTYIVVLCRVVQRVRHGYNAPFIIIGHGGGLIERVRSGRHIAPCIIGIGGGVAQRVRGRSTVALGVIRILDTIHTQRWVGHLDQPTIGVIVIFRGQPVGVGSADQQQTTLIIPKSSGQAYLANQINTARRGNHFAFIVIGIALIEDGIAIEGTGPTHLDQLHIAVIEILPALPVVSAGGEIEGNACKRSQIPVGGIYDFV